MEDVAQIRKNKTEVRKQKINREKKPLVTKWKNKIKEEYRIKRIESSTAELKKITLKQKKSRK